jgi:hypothetical protein
MKTIRIGDSGKEVSLLRDCLVRNGYRVDDVNAFTEATKAVVTDFQKKNGLCADGIAGYSTWEALLFCGRAASEKLTDEDFALLAQLLDCEPAALKAVQEVETGGRGGFFAPGKPAILFEGHIFWNQLKRRGIDPAKYTSGNENILYPNWEKGHYSGGMGEYNRLEQARRIHREAADASASWGMFQIMGFNFALCGERSVESFVKAMCESERKQLILSGRFIRQSGMLAALRTKNWAEFAKRYNGPAYALNRYDEKLAMAYAKFAR